MSTTRVATIGVCALDVLVASVAHPANPARHRVDYKRRVA
jgi:hypothetical protein